jgi:adenylate cyclase
MIKKFLDFITSLGVKATDSDDLRQEKNIIVGAAIASGSSALIWGLIYFGQGEKVAGSSLLFAGIVFYIYLPFFARTGNVSRLRLITFLLWLIIPPSAMWFLGGFYPASAMISWSFIPVILALMTSTIKIASRWFYAFFLFLVARGFIQPFLANDTLLPDNLITGFFVMNLGAISIIIYLALRYFIKQRNEAYAALEVEQEKSNNLLLNVLPEEIAEILKVEKGIIAERYDEASILFADLVGWTPLTAKLNPVEMIELLNEIFSYFDTLVEKYGVEKIRTIGDNYMVASGLPSSRKDHAQAIAEMALDMQEYIQEFPTKRGNRINFRIGINSGPVIAGVIGRKKFQYDVWGDGVITASRMESQGVAGKIQVTENTYRILKDEFNFEARGTIDVKGKGKMETWFLVGKDKK